MKYILSDIILTNLLIYQYEFKAMFGQFITWICE